MRSAWKTALSSIDDGVVSVPGFSKVRSIHESNDGIGAGASGLVVNGCTSGLVRDDLAIIAVHEAATG